MRHTLHGWYFANQLRAYQKYCTNIFYVCLYVFIVYTSCLICSARGKIGLFDVLIRLLMIRIGKLLRKKSFVERSRH